MVDALVAQGVLRSPDVIAAVRLVDPQDFQYDTFLEVDAEDDGEREEGEGAGEALVAALIAAYATLEHLAPAIRSALEPPRVLDLGAGSGFLAVCLAHLVRARGGRVYAIDCDEETLTATRARVALHPRHAELLHEGTLVLRRGDAWRALALMAPYDAIHCGAAVPSVPRAWLAQLRVGGVLVVAMHEAEGSGAALQRVSKVAPDRVLFSRILDDVDYAPLEGDPGVHTRENA